MSRVQVGWLFGVNHAAGVTAGEVGIHLACGTHGCHLVGFSRVGAQVREHHIRNISARLHGGGVLGVHIGAVDELFASRLGFAQSLFINDAIAGAVDEHRAIFHLANQLSVDEIARGGTTRHVNRDDIGRREDFL